MSTLRKLYYVTALDPNSPDFGEADSDCIDPDQARVEDDVKPNAVSSESRDNPMVHYPCIDVDKELIFGQRLVLKLMFGEATVVESKTPGHSHWYFNEPMDWDTYSNHLRTLIDCDVLEKGYVNASIARGGTYLRLPLVEGSVKL